MTNKPSMRERFERISQKTGVPVGTLRYRWEKGLRGKRLIEPPNAYQRIICGRTFAGWALEVEKETRHPCDRARVYKAWLYYREQTGDEEKALWMGLRSILENIKKEKESYGNA